MGHFNYLQTSSPIYTNFVNNLQFGQEILRSDSSHFLAKVIIVKFYMEYAKEIRAIADYNRAAMFATRACLLLKNESFENAIEEEVDPDVQASVYYLRKYHEWQERHGYKTAFSKFFNNIPTCDQLSEHEW